MRTRLALRWVGSGALVAGVAWCLWFFDRLEQGACSVQVQSATPNPTRTKYVVLASYDCGATTRTSTLAFVVDSLRPLPRASQSVLDIADTSSDNNYDEMKRRARSIAAEWVTADTLRIHFEYTLVARAGVDARGVHVVLAPQQVRRP